MNFISQFIDIYNEKQAFDVWLHKNTGRTWEEFRNTVTAPEIEVPDISKMLDESSRTLENFNPYEEVEHGHI